MPAGEASCNGTSPPHRPVTGNPSLPHNTGKNAAQAQTIPPHGQTPGFPTPAAFKRALT